MAVFSPTTAFNFAKDIIGQGLSRTVKGIGAGIATLGIGWYGNKALFGENGSASKAEARLQAAEASEATFAQTTGVKEWWAGILEVLKDFFPALARLVDPVIGRLRNNIVRPEQQKDILDAAKEVVEPGAVALAVAPLAVGGTFWALSGKSKGLDNGGGSDGPATPKGGPVTPKKSGGPLMSQALNEDAGGTKSESRHVQTRTHEEVSADRTRTTGTTIADKADNAAKGAINHVDDGVKTASKLKLNPKNIIGTLGALAVGGLTVAAASAEEAPDAESQVGSTDLKGTNLQAVATSSIVVPTGNPGEYIDDRGIFERISHIASDLNPITGTANTLIELKDAWDSSATWGDLGEKMAHKTHNAAYSFQESVLSLGSAPEAIYDLADQFAFGGRLPGDGANNASAEAIRGFSEDNLISAPALRDEWDARTRDKIGTASYFIPAGGALKTLGASAKLVKNTDRVVEGLRMFAAPVGP